MSNRWLVHTATVAGLGALLIVTIIYPFLPGDHDRLAVPISTMAQVFGVVGLGLAPIGIAWLGLRRHRFLFAILALLAATAVALVLALFATLSVGRAFGVVTLGAWCCLVAQLAPATLRLRRATDRKVDAAAVYLVLLPIIALAAQLSLAAPMAASSQERAIANAARFIRDIDRYAAEHGSYPISLQAQNQDYRPGVVGVERYQYVPQRGAYNLSFEQPRFLLDRFGTREWVVYNPHDTHRVYSHTAWMMPPEEAAEPSQGWYASRAVGHRHWRSFLFD